MNRNALLAFVTVFVVFGLGILAYADRARLVVLDPAGPIAYGEKAVIITTLALCAVIVVPVFVMLFVFAWTYRASNPKSACSHHAEWDHFSGVSEFLWWIPPMIIIFILGILAWKSSHALDPYIPLPGQSMEVDVVALDWKWLFIYPREGIASVNMLEIPEDTPVHFYLTADAPMNSFWVPSLGGQIMVMPGMTTQLNLEADRVGAFNGLSGNISGEGFAGMNFTVESVPQTDFNSWVQAIKQTNMPLTADSYAALAAPSSYNAVTYYSSVDPHLYIGISMRYMSAPIPMQGSMSGMQM
ncbi:MAG TPA: COX aromatic rich motif-containing protein [Candidatus Paceibacterota bacterium]|nr:COX aromatic rich motif-containing protein [Candidatus Paceibacterota bacterium]